MIGIYKSITFAALNNGMTYSSLYYHLNSSKNKIELKFLEASRKDRKIS